MKRPAGFTLLELMVVIAIVAVLAILAGGIFNRTMAFARQVECVNRMRQYGAATSVYASENAGAIVPPEGNSGGWYAALLPYLGKDSNAQIVLRCPTFVVKRHLTSDSAHTGYGMNLFFSSASGIAGQHSQEGFGNPARMSQILQPSKTPLFYDNESYEGGSAWGGYCVDGAGPWYYELYEAHGHGFNICFFDGHVELVKFDPDGPYEGKGAGDYPQFQWKPY